MNQLLLAPETSQIYRVSCDFINVWPPGAGCAIPNILSRLLKVRDAFGSCRFLQGETVFKVFCNRHKRFFGQMLEGNAMNLQ